MTTNNIARARAQRGAAYLDEVMPGWEAEIDLDSLMLCNASNCVLGQLYRQSQPQPRWVVEGYGSPEEWASLYRNSYDNDNLRFSATDLVCTANYDLGVALAVQNGVSDSDLWTVDHGFNSGPFVSFANLDVAWTELIEERRAVAESLGADLVSTVA